MVAAIVATRPIPIDQFQRVLLADQTTAVYRYLTSQPISTDSIGRRRRPPTMVDQ